MKNTDIFRDYDMVVSISERSINRELVHLTKLGVIKPEFVVLQQVVGNQYVFQVVDSPNDIPRGSDGNPTCACIDGQILPQVNIAESGTNITFVLQFRGGTAWFWTGMGPAARLQSYDMTGWKYGVTITLDLKAVERDDIGKGLAVPDLVKQQLYNFIDSMFSVNHLFMDFESTDLLRFDPSHTDTGKDAGDTGTQQFVEFMQAYLTKLVKNGNPFILGYSIVAPEAVANYQKAAAAAVPPDSLRPVGTTYSMYHEPDPANADFNSLNFVLVTKGGHAAIPGTPGKFDRNWLVPAEQCDGKMIISHDCLLEKMVFQPFYQSLRDNVYNGTNGVGGIHGNIDVSIGNDYAAGRAATPTGFAFTISSITTGNDRYVNTFTVDIANDAASATSTLTFKGSIYIYKETTLNVGVDTARAWGSSTVPWSGTVTLASGKDKDNNPALMITQSFVTGAVVTDSGKNRAAEALDLMGQILGWLSGGLANLIAKATTGDFLGDIFANAMSVNIPGVGTPQLAFQDLASTPKLVVMLPAGQVFYFRNPSTDSEANVSLLLTYKSDNDVPPPPPAKPAAQVVVGGTLAAPKPKSAPALATSVGKPASRGVSADRN